MINDAVYIDVFQGAVSVMVEEGRLELSERMARCSRKCTGRKQTRKGDEHDP